jgi:hypothetical protein
MILPITMYYAATGLFVVKSFVDAPARICRNTGAPEVPEHIKPHSASNDKNN